LGITTLDSDLIFSTRIWAALRKYFLPEWKSIFQMAFMDGLCGNNVRGNGIQKGLWLLEKIADWQRPCAFNTVEYARRGALGYVPSGNPDM